MKIEVGAPEVPRCVPCGIVNYGGATSFQPGMVVARRALACIWRMHRLCHRGRKQVQ